MLREITSMLNEIVRIFKKQKRAPSRASDIETTIKTFARTRKLLYEKMKNKLTRSVVVDIYGGGDSKHVNPQILLYMIEEVVKIIKSENNLYFRILLTLNNIINLNLYILDIGKILSEEKIGSKKVSIQKFKFWDYLKKLSRQFGQIIKRELSADRIDYHIYYDTYIGEDRIMMIHFRHFAIDFGNLIKQLKLKPEFNRDFHSYYSYHLKKQYKALLPHQNFDNFVNGTENVFFITRYYFIFYLVCLYFYFKK